MIAPARYADVACATALIVLVAMVLIVGGAPVYTDDLWWHLEAGEMYATEGPWPARDWMLFTARPEAPVQHEWLFGVAVHLLEGLAGFQGLRLVHVVLVAASIWLAWSLLRRQSQWPAGACLATCVFVVLASHRLFQLRPDLVSILFTLLAYRLLLEAREPPSRARVLIFVALVAVWANFHSLFMLSLNLLVAGILGTALAALAARFIARAAPAGGDGDRFRRTLVMLGAALVLGLIAALANPRGFHAHLTFLASSEQTAIWRITDEWSHFNPWRWRENHDTVSLAQWLAADVTLTAFAAVSLAGFVRLLLRRTQSALDDFDPVGFGLALASVVAMLASIRFMWMSIFVLLYVLGASHWIRAGRPRVETVAACIMAPAAVALAAWYFVGYVSANVITRFAAAPLEYVRMPYRTHKFHVEGVHLLSAAGVRGNLFNSYGMGGFLGYWLSPAIRTFIDSRTEHYEYSVFLDYSAVIEMKGVREGETFVDVLDRHDVDLFFGVGFPHWWHDVYTTTHLERMPGWLPVSRSFRHAIYLRDDARNRENLERIARYYAAAGIPFDERRGFDPGAAIRADPQWAIAHALLPPEYPTLVREIESEDRTARGRARNALGLIYFMAGAWELQVAFDRATVEEFPGTRRARQRLVYGLLRLDRVDEAARVAADLLALGPENPGSRRLAALVRRYRELLATRVPPEQARALRVKLNELLWRAEPLHRGEAWTLEKSMVTETLPLERSAKRVSRDAEDRT